LGHDLPSWPITLNDLVGWLSELVKQREHLATSIRELETIPPKIGKPMSGRVDRIGTNPRTEARKILAILTEHLSKEAA
jgi:hypothetical protein